MFSKSQKKICGLHNYGPDEKYVGKKQPHKPRQPVSIIL